METNEYSDASFGISNLSASKECHTGLIYLKESINVLPHKLSEYVCFRKYQYQTKPFHKDSKTPSLLKDGNLPFTCLIVMGL